MLFFLRPLPFPADWLCEQDRSFPKAKVSLVFMVPQPQIFVSTCSLGFKDAVGVQADLPSVLLTSIFDVFLSRFQYVVILCVFD